MGLVDLEPGVGRTAQVSGWVVVSLTQSDVHDQVLAELSLATQRSVEQRMPCSRVQFGGITRINLSIV